MLEARLAPKFIPRSIITMRPWPPSMEDISAYKNLRKELAAGRVYGHLSENLSDFLAQSLLPTTDLVMDRQEKKKQVKFFTNPELCDITEDLVLTEPYLAQPMNPRNKNIVTPGNEDFVREHLYEDEALHGEVAALRNGFMNNAQALIHGDLHSGSIFATMSRASRSSTRSSPSTAPWATTSAMSSATHFRVGQQGLYRRQRRNADRSGANHPGDL